MHQAALLLPLALWTSGIQALSPNLQKLHAAEVDLAEKRDEVVNVPGFVTFKMVGMGSSVRMPGPPYTMLITDGLEAEG